MKKIVAIGSHYDDIELGCGGTLLNHIIKKDSIRLYVTNCDEHLTGHPMMRYEEQDKSLFYFKSKTKKPNIDVSSFNESDNDKSIIAAIDYDKPDILFVPWEHDTHQDHRRASIIGQAAGRKRHITTFFYSSGSTYDFHPTIFNPINFDEKRELLKCYKSQIQCGAINIDIIEKREAYWASLISMTEKHAEGFIARKLIYPF